MPQTLKTSLLFLAAILVSLLTAEQAFRFYAFGTDALSPSQVNSWQGLGALGGLDVQTGVPRYTLKPNLDILHKSVRFRTDEQGYRIHKRTGAKRVAFIGDSFGVGVGVDENKTFAALLDDQSPATRYINFSVPGYSLGEYASIVARVESVHEFLIGFCPMNDFQPRTQGRLREYRNVFWGFSWLWHFMWQIPSKFQPEARYFTGPERYWVGVQLGKIRAATTLPMTIVFMARQPWGYVADLKNLVKSEGISFLDTTPAFGGNMKFKDTTLAPWDAHPNQSAIAKMADHYLSRKTWDK